MHAPALSRRRLSRRIFTIGVGCVSEGHDRGMSDNDLLPMPTDWQRGLVIVAHPDDIEYGAAAAIAAWTAAGHAVSYVLVTRGEAGIHNKVPAEAAPLREAEQRASAAAVGVDRVEFLDHPDGVIEGGPALRRDVAATIRRHRPQLVVTLNHHDTWSPGSWNSVDHRVVGRAVLDAVADAANRWIFADLVEEGLEPWGEVRWVAVAGSPYPTHAVDVSNALERATASLAAHRSYLEGLDDHPAEEQSRQWVEQVTASVSGRFGDVPAVGFELIGR